MAEEQAAVPVDVSTEPVKINPEDNEQLLRIQSFVDALAKYRQEMGRLVQLMGNMREEANKVEVELAEARRSLADKYNLEQMGTGQWALDFENREFVKTAPGTPVIP
jgi:hypothetical protein